MVIPHIWEWEGETSQYQDSSVITMGNPPPDPFPAQDIINAAQITILAETTAVFQAEMLKAGFTVTVTKIEPVVWFVTTLEQTMVRDRERYTWHHWLHMKAKVYFDSDKPVIQSPLDPVTMAALVIIIKYLIAALVAGLVIYGIATVLINSFSVRTHTITKTTTNPDGTTTTTTETITEPITEPALGGWIAPIVLIILVLGGGYIALQYFGKKKGRRRSG